MKTIIAQVAQTELAFVALADWEVVTLRGSDRKSFLKGLLTNEVVKLTPGDNNDSLLLTAKGRIQHEVNVSCLTDELLLLTSPGQGEAVRSFLDFYHVMEDLSMTAKDPIWRPLLLMGTTLPKWLAARSPAWPWPESRKGVSLAVPSPLDTSALSNIWLTRIDRLAELPALLLWVSADQHAAWVSHFQKEGVTELDKAEWQAQRNWYGWVEASTVLSDLLVHEAGLQESHISYTKGCFVGQEVVARTQHRGKPNKGVFVVQCEEPQILAKADEIIDDEGKVWGEILGVCPLPSGQVGHHALIKLKAIEEKTALFVGDKVPIQRVFFGARS